LLSACTSRALREPTTPTADGASTTNQRNSGGAEKPRAPKGAGRELTDLVAAGGLRWMVATRPQRLLAALRETDSEFITTQRLDAFAEASGVDLRNCSEAVIASYADGELYITRAENSADAIRSKVAARRTRAVESAALAPDATREPMLECFELDADVVAVTSGSPLPGKAAQAFYAGRLQRSPAALGGSSFGALPTSSRNGDLRVYATGPLPAPDTQSVLAQVSSLCVALELEQGKLVARVYTVGDYDAGDEARLLAALQQLLRSDLGALLALDHGADTCAERKADSELWFECTFDAAPLLRAARGVLESRLDLIFDRPKPAP
jgi:hypothetical protein